MTCPNRRACYSGLAQASNRFLARGLSEAGPAVSPQPEYTYKSSPFPISPSCISSYTHFHHNKIPLLPSAPPFIALRTRYSSPTITCLPEPCASATRFNEHTASHVPTPPNRHYIHRDLTTEYAGRLVYLRRLYNQDFNASRLPSSRCPPQPSLSCPPPRLHPRRIARPPSRQRRNTNASSATEPSAEASTGVVTKDHVSSSEWRCCLAGSHL